MKHPSIPPLPEPAETRNQGLPCPVKVQCFTFDRHHLHEYDTPDALPTPLPAYTWIRVQGRPDSAWMARYREQLALHPLSCEDVLEGGQRAKMEPYDGQLFVVMNVPCQQAGHIVVEQMYLYLFKRHLVTFFEGKADPFEPLVRRLHNPSTRLRQSGLDYLFYSLLDIAIDQTFPVLENLGDRLEVLEEELVASPGNENLETLYKIRRDLILLRHGIWPQREVIDKLSRDTDEWISEPIRIYLRDCYDHALQIMAMLESYRDMSASLLELYLSSVSVRTNEIMRVLTVIATIFMPLTFITGIYGMNFHFMPELGWRFGYPMVLGLCATIAAGMLLWFRRRNWF